MGWHLFAVAAVRLVRDSPNLPFSNSGKVAQVLSQPMLELVWGGRHENFSATEDLDLVRRSQCYLITWNLSNLILHYPSIEILIQTGWALSWPQSSHTFQLMLYTSMGCSPLFSLCPSSYPHSSHPHIPLLREAVSYNCSTRGHLLFLILRHLMSCSLV